MQQQTDDACVLDQGILNKFLKQISLKNSNVFYDSTTLDVTYLFISSDLDRLSVFVCLHMILSNL